MCAKIWVENNPLFVSSESVTGEYVYIGAESYYKISHYDRMSPFFMSLVSHADHWMFISSKGGLSAGRINENNALFPYYTDDKITDYSDITGSKTLILVSKENKKLLWLPFSDQYRGSFQLERNLYKNRTGNKLIFEEINHSLSLSFNYSWTFSDKYGFVKSSYIVNLGEKQLACQVLDGLQNLLPNGVDSAMQKERSNLVDAYKRNELEPISGLGIYALSAMIVDRAEPSEALKASVCWTIGLKPNDILLSSLQLDRFKFDGRITPEKDIKGFPGAYFVHHHLQLEGGESSSWKIIADVNKDHSDINSLIDQLSTSYNSLEKLVENDIDAGNLELLHKIAKADGLQLSADQLATGRHTSNVLFNIMRGGLFEDHYSIQASDFITHIHKANQPLSSVQAEFLESLPSSISQDELMTLVQSTGNPDLIRLSYEYLPLSFSRRHGDPSRPWNKFSIDLKNKDGSSKKYYQGNWRDIFQNWEALALSIPDFIHSMIVKFVNASTIDGYNPYRITSDGIDWEVVEPDDPWSYIGYWGDHQIIYLQKLLEISDHHFPGKLSSLMDEAVFVYANVPYRIKSYDNIVANPKDTIEYHNGLEEVISGRVKEIGADGKIIYGENGQPIRATLIEKLLVTLLTKLSNFVPDAGIWLNTQRPEWNDANNALVGNGVSMVTLYYMRRYVAFLHKLIDSSPNSLPLNKALYSLWEGIYKVLQTNQVFLLKRFTDQQRRSFVDQLGQLGENYRNKVYQNPSNEKTTLKTADLSSFLELTLQYIDHSIRANKRADDLYHAYNLINFSGDQLSVSNLYEMLEGQVAILSSGILTASESLQVLDALKSSKMYREDQYSYMLYPNRELPGFLDKNNIPNSFVDNSALAKQLLSDSNQELIIKDVKGKFHFNGEFHNSDDLRAKLDELKLQYGHLVENEYEAYLEIFEEIFDHKSFTGRSGTFYGYEGLGSIYWHMVSKLLLAVQENLQLAINQNEDKELIAGLVQHYYEIRAGIGINKSPELYGAFPTDPYSHTPGHKGAQQPGMTGQVKEDIMNRWGELGVKVSRGCISFAPEFLHPAEFINKTQFFEYFTISGDRERIELNPGELAFTYCQVPVIYKMSDRNQIELEKTDRQNLLIDALKLTPELSAHLFSRDQKISKIRVFLKIN
jgi:hypothetical protein